MCTSNTNVQIDKRVHTRPHEEGQAHYSFGSYIMPKVLKGAAPFRSSAALSPEPICEPVEPCTCINTKNIGDVQTSTSAKVKVEAAPGFFWSTGGSERSPSAPSSSATISNSGGVRLQLPKRPPRGRCGAVPDAIVNQFGPKRGGNVPRSIRNAVSLSLSDWPSPRCRQRVRCSEREGASTQCRSVRGWWAHDFPKISPSWIEAVAGKKCSFWVARVGEFFSPRRRMQQPTRHTRLSDKCAGYRSFRNAGIDWVVYRQMTPSIYGVIHSTI